MRAATVVQSCRTCFLFYCMFYFTCDRSFSAGSITVLTAQQIGECIPELGRHGVIQQRVDGAVGVDGNTAAQQKPAVHVATPGERVVHDQRSVRQPQRCERRHNQNQHLYYLSITAVIYNGYSRESTKRRHQAHLSLHYSNRVRFAICDRHAISSFFASNRLRGTKTY